MFSVIQKSLPILIIAATLGGAFSIGSVGIERGQVVVTPTQVAEATWTIRTCDVTASAYTVESGSNITISWTTQGFSTFTLNGATVSGPNGSKTFTNIQANTTYTLEAVTADGKSNCVTAVTVTCIPVPPPTCTLTPTSQTVDNGASVNLAWTTTNADSASLTEFGNVSLSGSQSTGPLTADKSYTLTVAGKNGTNVSCHSNITVRPVVVPPPTCTLTPATATIAEGDTVTLNWTTTNAATAGLTDFGAVALSGSQVTPALVTNKNYTLNVVGTDGSSVSCHSNITVTLNPPKVCELTLTKSVNKTTALPGDELIYTLIIKNTGTKDCTGGGVQIVDIHDVNLSYVSETHSANLTAGYNGTPLYTAGTRTLVWNGNILTPGEEGTITWIGKVNPDLSCGVITKIPNQAKATAFELNNFTTWVYSNTVETSVTKDCPTPTPICDSFTAQPQTITKGASANLTWATRNASRVVINNGLGEVAATGTLSVSPLSTIEYILTAYGVGTTTTSCKTTVTVTEVPVPVCTAFTATPASLPIGGGNVTLAWTSTNASSASITPTVGGVAVNGSTTLALSTSTTFTLTVAGENNQTNACTVTVPVQPPVPVPFTCANNVSFSASPDRITRGNDSTLSWNTTGATSVSFNQGITATGLSGTLMVEPNDTTTYVLTASNGTTTVACPVTVTVTSGGGGGGSSSPTCELSVSKNSINSGETVTLRYDSSRASDLKLVDSNGKTLLTTRGKTSSEKSDLLDGTLKVSPKSDTTYTLTVERGSKDRVCKVKVDVKDNVVVTQIRDQQPLVSGISLTEVPYTGFEAGPLLTMSFYLLLMAWALYIAYILVIKRDIIGGYRLVLPRGNDNNGVATPESIRPDVFVAAVRTPEVPPSIQAPANLPTSAPVIGYAAQAGAVASPVGYTETTDEDVTTLENYAHAKKALLSSDAIRHLIGTTNSAEQRLQSLNDVITEAKATYPSEDGWVVINEKRMRELCLVCQAKPEPSSVAPYVPTVIPEGSGSLAEAIVTGNIVAAYEMIGHRPMFALADAAADMDSVLRARRGGKEVISDMLLETTKSLSEEQVIKIIEALTGALDGTYTDEASAVKMAIMKAVKVVA